MISDMMLFVDNKKVKFDGLERDLTLVKRADTRLPVAQDPLPPSKTQVPKPKAFSGTHNAKELVHFPWDME